MKIAKLSLVAAVAVAGLSTANAQPLEEAIKGVEVSGSVVYRYNDYNNDSTDTNADGQNIGFDANGKKIKPVDGDEGSNTDNNYKVALNLSSKVNEDVKFNSRFLVGGADGGFASLDTQNSGDSNVDVELSNAYFGYTGIANTTVNVGKQGLTTPWTTAVDSAGNEQTGTGALALTTVGPVTFAAAYFNQTNLNNSGNIKIGDGSDDIATVGAIAKLGVVTADAWYIDAEDILDSYTVGAAAKFDVSGIAMGVDARYTGLTLDDPVAKTLKVDEDSSLAKIVLTADAGLVDVKLAYATTDKDGGKVALDNDAVTNIQGWSVSANDKADADFYQASLGFDVLANLHLSANYTNVDYVDGNDDKEEEEIYGQLVYKMSKNLTTLARYGVYSNEVKNAATSNADEVNDDVRGRLQVAYTF